MKVQKIYELKKEDYTRLKEYFEKLKKGDYIRLFKNFIENLICFKRELKGRETKTEIEKIKMEIKTIKEKIEMEIPPYIPYSTEWRNFKRKQSALERDLKEKEKELELRLKTLENSGEEKKLSDNLLKLFPSLPEECYEEYIKKTEEEPVILPFRDFIWEVLGDEVDNFEDVSESFTITKNGKEIKCFYFIFKQYVYRVEGFYTAEEASLLVLEAFDRERKKFERLKMLYASDEVKKESKSRPHIPEEVKIIVWRRDGGRCVKCGSRENLEFDHIIPLSKGGSNTARNIQLLCAKCNREKKDNIV